MQYPDNPRVAQPVASPVAQWLKAASVHAGVDLTLEDGHCRMVLDDGTQCVLELSPDGDLLFLYVPLVAVPPEPAAAVPLLKAALKLNMFGLRTFGASYGYDERAGQILLTASSSIDELDEELFCALLGAFVTAAMEAKDSFDEVVAQMKNPTPALRGDR